MTGFDTPFPPLAIVVLTGLLAAWVLWKRPAITPRAAWGLSALRVIGLILVALLLLNPFVSRQLPDASQFAIAVVGDVSRSMETGDLPGGKTRLERLQEAVAAGQTNNLWDRLSDQYLLEPSTIVQSWQAGPSWDARNGDTAIGTGLVELLDKRPTDAPNLGGVVLLSDGINLVGERVPDAAVAFREAGIPVSTIGIGEPTPPGDIGIKFTDTPDNAPLGDPLTLSVDVLNNFPEDRTVEIQLFQESELLGEQAITISSQSEDRVSFDFVPETPGLQVYRAILKERAEGDFNRVNDLDYAAVDITLPENQSMLYLSARLGPFWRYLQQALGDDDQVTRQCIIQTGPERFYRQGFEEETSMDEATLGFPESGEEFFPHSVLIVDISAVVAMSEDAREGLREYLLRRGGGVLFLGDPNEMPKELEGLLPVRDGEMARVLSRTPIELANQPVFPDASGGVLGLPPGPYLPAESMVFQPESVSLGARVAAEAVKTDTPVLMVHAYGAGRSAYIGTESTWRWALTSDRENEQHSAFWRQLLAWLATGGKPRVELPIQGQVLPLGSPADIDLLVRGSDFRPSEDAQIRATITTPGGAILPELGLIPQANESGRFAGELLLDESGEYRIDYSIEFPDGETLEQTAYFAARRAGRENEDLRFRENTLRDLARISGGRYYAWRDIDQIDELPLAASVPVQEERTHWTRNGLFLILLLGAFGAEWFWRRNMGLR
ncbi:MAG: vWA domain-containing protein [Verrucomicrobiota bacterium]